MSLENKTEIICPKCKAKHPFTIWSSINTMLDPEMKAEVQNGSAFMFTCPDCKAQTMVNYPCLYHNMEKKILIQLSFSDEERKQVCEMFTGKGSGMIGMLGSGYIKRVVGSVNELREKVAIFEAGLDDRIIEIYKLYVQVSLHTSNPGHGELKMLFYSDAGNNFLQLFDDGAPKGYAQVQKPVYDDIVSKLPDLEPLSESGPIVDQQTGVEMMRRMKQ